MKSAFKVEYEFDFFKAHQGSGSRLGPLILLKDFVKEVQLIEAHINEYDEYWKARELEAIVNLDKAYHPNPEEMVRHYNDHFSTTMLDGKGGEFYVVTDPIDNTADPKPGSLHHVVTKTGPLWITFKGSKTIKLEQELIVTSDKTIDAGGANVKICNGAGITFQFGKTVICHGLQIHHIILAKGGKIKDGENHLGL
ncbi:hypothetical protein Gogos_022171 [Gossypium gossypioides]|uniref:Pectate lyase N-terminal domain-containing protein n=1 Tax=Gossypium gossypioides TaxID=34282 RepID=A0A7J9D4J5_GOSGO|nr:hypothetical protein [Gossypium gossypioides]